MELIKGIIKSITTWVFASIFIIIIILIPRDVEYKSTAAGVFQKATYNYSIEKHIASFNDLYSYIKENNSLGRYSDYYTVEDILVKTIKMSAKTVIPALILAFILGILKGILDQRLSLRKWGIIGKGTTWILLSIPDFFLVVTLQVSLMFLFDLGLAPHIDLFGSDDKDNVMMAIIYLMIYPLFYMASITSSAIEEEAGKDYIRTARSKGIMENIIVYRHILANASVKIFRHLNTIVLYMLSNLFIIERFTDYRGAGYYFLKTVFQGSHFAVGSNQNLGLPSLAISYTLIFTAFILIIHIISQAAVYKLTPFELGDKL